jgi:EmrB/QacA subfamily drug resistance transporter
MNPAPPVDYGRKWHALAAVGSGVFLATVDSSIVNVALPTLMQALDTQFAVVQWVVLAYLLTVTTTMPGIGRLADILGRKPLYSAGFAIFTAASALCGLAPSIAWLIACRVLQAAGAAMIMALGSAIVVEAFPPGERGKAMGAIGAVVSAGIIVGPAAGGLLLATFSWRAIFYVNLPVGIAGLLMVRRTIADHRPRGGQRFDLPGALALLAALLCLLLGLTFGQRQGFLHPQVLALMAAWVGALLLFLRIERRTPQPMIDLRLFRRAPFSVNLATGFMSFVALAGALILMPFYLQNILGCHTLQVGMLMGVIPVMLGLVAPLSGALSDRVGSRPITVIGLGTLLAGMLAAGTLTEATGPAGVILRIFPVGLGIGLFISPNNSAIMGAAEPHQLGVVSGLMALTRTLGQTVGVALLGAVWAGRTALHAGRSLAGGVAAAPLRAQMEALHDTFHTAAAVLALAVFLGLWAWLRERRPRCAPPDCRGSES